MSENSVAGPTRAAAGTVTTILVAISFSHMLNDTIQSLFPALYPLLKDSFHLSYTQIGLITLVFQMTASLLQPVVGLYTDRRPKPYSLAVGMGFSLDRPPAPVACLELRRDLLVAAALVGPGLGGVPPGILARRAHGVGRPLRLRAVASSRSAAMSARRIGPLAAAFIVIPGGQGSIAWFSLVALLAIFVLANVGGWYTRQIAQHQAGGGKRRRSQPHGLSHRAVSMLSLAVLLALTFSKFFYHGLPDQLLHLLPHPQIRRLGAGVAALSLRLPGGGGGRHLLRRPARRPFRPQAGDLVLHPRRAALLACCSPTRTSSGRACSSVLIGMIMASAFSAIVVFAQELVPGRVGMIAGIFFGVAFGMGGIGAAVLGVLADATSIEFVFRSARSCR